MPVPIQGTQLYTASDRELRKKALECSEEISKLTDPKHFEQVLEIVRNYYNGMKVRAVLDFEKKCKEVGIDPKKIPSLKQALFGGDLGINW